MRLEPAALRLAVLLLRAGTAQQVGEQGVQAPSWQVSGLQSEERLSLVSVHIVGGARLVLAQHGASRPALET